MFNRKGNKQWQYLLAVVLAVTLLLTGCGGSQSSQPAAPQGEQSKETAPEAAAEGTAGQQSTNQEAAPATGGDDRDSVIASLSAKTFPTEMSYEMTYGGEGETMTSSIWLKGNKSRVEGTNPMEGSFLIIEDGTYSYILQPDEMTGIRMEYEDDDFYDDDDDYFDDDLIDGEYDWEGMTFKGVESLNGVRTYVFHDVGDNMTLWVHADYAFPVRIEGNEDGYEYYMEITNLKVGGISDALFAVPDGYDIMELGW